MEVAGKYRGEIRAGMRRLPKKRFQDQKSVALAVSVRAVYGPSFVIIRTDH